MQFIDIRRIKVILVISAVIIAVASLYFSHRLVKDLSMEERLKMEVWAEAMRAFSVADENVDLNLVLKVLNANNTIPVIVSDAEGNIQTYRNIEIASNNEDLPTLFSPAIRFTRPSLSICKSSKFLKFFICNLFILN